MPTSSAEWGLSQRNIKEHAPDFGLLQYLNGARMERVGVGVEKRILFLLLPGDFSCAVIFLFPD